MVMVVMVTMLLEVEIPRKATFKCGSLQASHTDAFRHVFTCCQIAQPALVL